MWTQTRGRRRCQGRQPAHSERTSLRDSGRSRPARLAHPAPGNAERCISTIMLSVSGLCFWKVWQTPALQSAARLNVLPDFIDNELLPASSETAPGASLPSDQAALRLGSAILGRESLFCAAVGLKGMATVVSKGG